MILRPVPHRAQRADVALPQATQQAPRGQRDQGLHAGPRAHQALPLTAAPEPYWLLTQRSP
eukprot:14377203-Alexandrium_andersonii.AAC.1